MSDAWIPVFLAAIIVIGVVGGSVIKMVLKELMPLLRRIAEERTQGALADPGQRELLAGIDRRLRELESGQRQLREEAEFLQRLVEDRGGRASLPEGASDPRG
jgi:hypothetical protein